MKEVKSKNSLYLMLVGMVMGCIMMIPGVSGGVMAVILGIYEPLVMIAARPWHNWRENLKFGLPLALGALVSILIMSNILSYLLSEYPLLVKYLFIGLVAGSIPGLAKVANERGFERRYLASFLVGLMIMLIPMIAAARLESPPDLGTEITGLSLWQSVLSGFLLALGTVVPGVSSSFLLIIAGTYGTMLRAVAELKIIELFPLGIAAAVSALLISRAISYLLRRYFSWTYYGLLGIVVGSTIVVFPGLPSGFSEGLLAFILLFLGTAATLRLSRIKPKNQVPL
ncbi:MAG: DUF368 domain-containing protein [Limnochordia bacterium]|nr:DUF368 domain-containing protein [Bacillota bacterium]HOB08593.1 DUF368 domain-containing protein [Limnochordia bacterium]NLH31269.1 DUF368 domain-containing protein [Bacillota bacterium]HPT92741.1 DUF368 domain-containing protein [Limnochordia bacterium]HPZ30734.1 DUF368 domain-containing protein [Limnochordia bacterium]